MHAISAPLELLTSSFTNPSRSGIENAMAGIWEAYLSGIVCSPFEANDPAGTVVLVSRILPPHSE